ncbi:MAG: hypothetical protein ABLQ96_10135, partial [Candidatus Acidiferrum sp.]
PLFYSEGWIDKSSGLPLLSKVGAVFVGSGVSAQKRKQVPPLRVRDDILFLVYGFEVRTLVCKATGEHD